MYNELIFLKIKFSDLLKFTIFLHISRTLTQKGVYKSLTWKYSKVEEWVLVSQYIICFVTRVLGL